MTFAAPLFMWAAVAVAAGTVALHLLAWRRPPETPLPTARFVPDVPVRTVSRALRPSDLALLALRVLLVLLVGAALGRPIVRSRTPGVGRVIVLDQSRGARVSAAVADSARLRYRPGDVLIALDSTARESAGATRDSIAAVGGPRVNGFVSAGLIAAIRAAGRVARERDSVEIVIVSPFDASEIDAALSTVRVQWPGAVRAVRVGVPPNEASVAGRVVVRAPTGDPVAAAISLSGAVRAGGDVRVVRDSLSAVDSAWAAEGHTVVAWPAAAPSGWPRRPREDTAYAVSLVSTLQSVAADGGGATIVAPIPRAIAAPPGRVIARWQDGEPAATDRALGTGCVRAVAVAVPAAGDLALTPAFRRFAERLTMPCGSSGLTPSLSDRELAALLPPSAATASNRTSLTAGVSPNAPVSRLSAWLLALAMAAAVVELVVRRGSSNAAA